jgi:hypothetical protein
MFIPAQTPDLQQPLTQLLEVKPVVPVSAVPGIPEDAQHLDSRVALQWTQPVLQAEKGQTARTALSVPLAVQIVKPFNTKGFESQGPDPDALLKGEVHPMLEEGLASWINFVLSKPASNFRLNGLQSNAASTTETASDDEIKETPEAHIQSTIQYIIPLFTEYTHVLIPQCGATIDKGEPLFPRRKLD